jgi:hypothetical protein
MQYCTQAMVCQFLFSLRVTGAHFLPGFLSQAFLSASFYFPFLSQALINLNLLQ